MLTRACRITAALPWMLVCTSFGLCGCSDGPTQKPPPVANTKRTSLRLIPAHWRNTKWAELEDAYGPADRVPRDIWALSSPYEPTRRDALENLYGSIFHQGSRYPATVSAIPLLFELADDRTTPDRASIVVLLVDLAVGYASEYLPAGIRPEEAFPPNGDESERASYRAVETRVSNLIALTADPDRKVRMAAVYALAWFPALSRESVPCVRARCVRAVAASERANAIVALGLLTRASGSKADIALLNSCLSEQEPAAVRFSASVALAALPGRHQVEQALSVLAQEVGRLDSHGKGAALSDYPSYWNDGDLAGYAALALAALAKGREPHAVQSLCDALGRGEAGATRHSMSEALLRVAFGETPPPRDPTGLTTLQRQALTAIARHGAWRLAGAVWIDFAHMMRAAGLPDTEEGLRAYLRGKTITGSGPSRGSMP